MNWKDLLKQAVFFCRFPLFAAAQPFVTHASRRQYSSSSSSSCRKEQLQSHFGHNSCWATQRPESLRRQSPPRPAHGHGLTLRTGASYLTFNRNMSKPEQNGFQHKIQNLLICVFYFLFSPSICLICNIFFQTTFFHRNLSSQCTENHSGPVGVRYTRGSETYTLTCTMWGLGYRRADTGDVLF